MLVARFSENIQNDINRGWSSFMYPGLGGTYNDCLQDIEEFGGKESDIREFPEYPGCFGVVHHTGLSCYYLESETVEDAVKEAKSCKGMDGSGFADKTVGNVKLVRTISAKVCGSQRDLHILEVEDCESEGKY